MRFWWFLVLIPLYAHAGIFGADSRVEAYQADSEVYQRARATPALIREEMLVKEGESYIAKPISLQKMGMCSDTAFGAQKSLANCSASLIAPDIILTAAHCIETQGADKCGNYHIVFDYAEGESTDRFNKEQVFHCKDVLYYKYDLWNDKEDLAIIQLDRAVTDRAPIKLSSAGPKVSESVTLLGYPLGIPLKSVDDGVVSLVNAPQLSFRHNLDTFSCNSGGPVFNGEGEQIGVLVRGTGTNFDTRPGAGCYDWGKSGEKDWAEANSLLHLKAIFKQLF
jgi:V8-like Glu-specific endopeptidase